MSRRLPHKLFWNHGEGTQMVKAGPSWMGHQFIPGPYSIYGFSTMLKRNALKVYRHHPLLPEHLTWFISPGEPRTLCSSVPNRLS